MKERWHFHRREYNLYPKDYNRIEINSNPLTLLLRDVKCALLLYQYRLWD